MLVAQSCLTLCDPMICPWNSLGKSTEVGCQFPSPGDLPDPVTNLGSPALEAGSLLSELLKGKCFVVQKPRLKGKLWIWGKSLETKEGVKKSQQTESRRVVFIIPYLQSKV